MLNRIVFLSLALSFIFFAAKGQYCTNDSRYTEAMYFDSTEITLGANIQYGTALDYLGNPYPLQMDIYYPNLAVDASPKRPFVLLFHGGGFSSGDKQSGDIRDLCVHLALRGFVCATVNYRLGHDFSEYGQYKVRYRAIQDGKAAMRYIVNNANTIRIDTDWLFVGGQSAGSLLALGMVYADQFELDSISLLYNATAASAELGNLHTSGNNLTNTYSIKGIFNNWGGVVESEIDLEEMIPTIAFHGDLDTEVEIGSDNSFANYSLNGSGAIHQDLTANNICSELTVDLTGGHGIFRNASSLFRAQRASCFFKSIFCNTCQDFYSTDSIPPNCGSTLQVEESLSESDFNVYPNPVENSFKIEGINGLLEVTIYNSLGQQVYKNQIANGRIETELPSGISFMTIKQVGTVASFTTKLVKN